ncbi:unnamed protein product [Polarella glacialis]|uniref:Protein kinase domain-containing protein n=1 Tax=Polarella glacialis TaxID=89957 RepID=A0A813FKT1_POLGL|nr:unnamed protein product [Polarella glacialis]
MALRCVARSLLSMAGDASEVKEYARQAMECGDEAAGFTLGFELHSYLGTALERERNYVAAEKHFAAALRAKPGDEAVMLALARTLVGTQRKEKKVQARQLYEQVVASNPGSSEGYIRLAEMSLEADDFSEAYRMAAQAAKLAPSDPTALAILGKASMKTGRTEEGVRVLEQASALQPNTAAADLLALQALAQAHKKAGRDQDAISCFKRVLDARPGDYECNLSLGQLHSARGAAGASQAVHYYRSALQSRPSTREARDIYMQMAGVQCAISAWKDAQQTLEGAVRELPEDAEIWRKLLIVYEEQKDSKGQHQCFRRLGQLGCLQPADKVQCSELLMSEGQFREARDLLDQVLRAEPSNTAALLKVAASWRQDPTAGERALSEAKARYEQVLQLSPSNAEALEGAAYCYRKVNNLEQAITLYQQCLKVKPTAEGPLYYLGDILYKQHRHAECQHYLSRLVETNCTTEYKTGALYILAKSHVSLDEYAEAEAQARTGLAVKPNHPHFLFIFALVKNRMADYDSSISTLKKALQHCDAADSAQLVVEIRDWLAQAYERKHEYAAAMAELDRALQQDPSHASSLITQGLVHVHLKQLEQAETSFRRALAVEKNHALALVRLGYCKLLANDYQEATAFFQRALQQRCGTLALPHSVKGAARIYMALSLMSQQDMEGAILQVSEARKSHRNFNAVCTQGKDVIVRGECEGLVAKLRAIPDLDLNLAQAWQLVELMAKDLEIGLKDPAASRGASRAASEAAASPFGAGSPQAFAMSSPVAGGAGQERRQWLSAEIGGSPSAGGSAAPASQERRMWTAQASTPAMSPPAAPERRQWTAPKAPEPPKQEEEAVQMSSTVQMAGGLKLAKHEQIEMDELTQHECLGTGGFGAVYRGYFKNQEVAIKKLFCEDGGNISPLQLDELEKEVAALRSVNHPRLVRFIGACLTPPNLVIVTEFMPGGSLHHLLHKAKTPLTIGQQAKMALQVCEGAAFLHSSKPPVVHRDLKSLNVILDRIYNAKICDFGLTQSMDNTHISLKEGGGGGSPRYMAPECYDCKGKITEKVDVWALGCILVEIFGGPLPYDDCSNIQQIVAKVLIDKEIPYIPNHLPRGVRPVVEDCFNFDPKARTSSQSVYNRMLELNLVTN